MNKKKQKNFDNLDRDVETACGLEKQRFLVLFFKKELLAEPVQTSSDSFSDYTSDLLTFVPRGAKDS